MLSEAPWAFGASPADDFSRSEDAVEERLAREDSAVLSIEDPQPHFTSHESGRAELVAAAGVIRQTRVKFRHRARIWGVYVAPEHRGRGYGRAVVGGAIELARAWAGVDYVDLAVSEGSPHAWRLYEKLGFTAWGREPEATEVDGLRYDEIHMTLRL